MINDRDIVMTYDDDDDDDDGNDDDDDDDDDDDVDDDDDHDDDDADADADAVADDAMSVMINDAKQRLQWPMMRPVITNGHQWPVTMDPWV